MASESFRPGEVVKVKELRTSPEMIVIGPNLGSQVKCFWFTAEGHGEHGTFSASLLVPAARDKPK